MTTLRTTCLYGIAAVAVVCSGIAQGRGVDKAADLYSRGVHAYFAGRAGEAEMLLSQSLGFVEDDPRIFYFRALSRLRMGRSAEARTDMAIGAELEASRPNRYPVGAALQRVQGGERLMLEKYRRAARESALTIGAHISQQHAEQMAARDQGALRERVVIPLDELLRPEGPQPLTAEEVARRAAARREQAMPRRSAPALPAPVVDSSNNPFDDDEAFAPDESPAARSTQPTRLADPERPVEAPVVEENESDNPFDF